MAGWRIALLGSDSIETDRLLECLSESTLDIDALLPFAGTGDDGDTVLFRGRPVEVDDYADCDFSKIDVAIFLAVGNMPAALLDDAISADIYVLDASGGLLVDEDIPLHIAGFSPALATKTFAIGDAVSSAVVLFLKSILPKVARIDCFTCMAVSVHGRAAVEALARETAGLLATSPVEENLLGEQIAFNVLTDLGGSLAAELESSISKAAGDAIEVNASVVTTPTFFGHTVRLRVECVDAVDLALISTAIAENSRFRRFPIEGHHQASVAALKEADCIDVDDLRVDRKNDTVLHVSLLVDSLRQGAVFNLVDLLEILIKDQS